MRRPMAAFDKVPSEVLWARENGLEALRRRLASWDKDRSGYQS